MNQTPGIAQLIHPEHAGDWHDKPMRYVVDCGPMFTQKFSTLRHAQKWASVIRRNPTADFRTVWALWDKAVD